MIRLLPHELQQKSERELNERSEQLRDDLRHIQEWITKETYLNVRTDEQLLVTFLRGCKFSLQRTKDKLKKMYTMRALNPEFFHNRDPFSPEIQEALDCNPVIPLRRKANSTAPHVILLRASGVDPSKVLLITVTKIAFMIIDILLWEDDSFVICGQHGVVDPKGVTLDHIIQITPSFMKKAVSIVEDAYPCRVKGVHLLNTPSIFQKVVNLAKPLFSEKLRNRIHLYDANNMDDFYKQIPKDILPPEYGGEGDSYNDLKAFWKNKVESYRDWFLEDAKYRADMKQLGYDVLELEGSFRKLEVD